MLELRIFENTRCAMLNITMQFFTSYMHDQTERETNRSNRDQRALNIQKITKSIIQFNVFLGLTIKSIRNNENYHRNI